MRHENIKILVTLGPSSLKKDIIEKMDKKNIYLFRINMSHTSIEDLEQRIYEIKKYTDTPLCLDSEGAQIRNGKMVRGKSKYKKSEIVKIHSSDIIGDDKNISFTPNYIFEQLEEGDILKIDFNSAQIKIVEKHSNYCTAKVEVEGEIGSNKATDVDRDIMLDAITPKDREAIKIGKEMGIKHFALSFAGSEKDVEEMRELVGIDSKIISKIESINGLKNIEGILKKSDEILIDRGDLSRQVCLEKIPFLQRRIISIARSMQVPVNVATNLLESMIGSVEPTRAEINDVVSTILMGANGLVLAAETAVGAYPFETVEMVRKLTNQLNKWTPNSSINDILYY